jgi:hypothetical protein
MSLVLISRWVVRWPSLVWFQRPWQYSHHYPSLAFIFQELPCSLGPGHPVLDLCFGGLTCQIPNGSLLVARVPLQENVAPNISEPFPCFFFLLIFPSLRSTVLTTVGANALQCSTPHATLRSRCGLLKARWHFFALAKTWTHKEEL